MRGFLLRLEGYFKRMPERDQKIFPYFLFVCVFILFYYGLISPIEQKTKTLKRENDNLEQKVFLMKSKVSVLGTVKLGMKKKQQRLNELKDEFYRLKKRVPEKDEISRIVKSLAKAEKVSYLIKEVNEHNYIKHDTYTEIPLSISLNGDFYHIYNFLKTMENTDRFFLINGATFVADPKTNGNVEVTLDLSAFKLMELDYYIDFFTKSKKTEGNGVKNGKK